VIIVIVIVIVIIIIIISIHEHPQDMALSILEVAQIESHRAAHQKIGENVHHKMCKPADLQISKDDL